MIKNHGKIVIHYLKGWFTIDFISQAPLAVEIFTFTSSSSDVSDLSLLRIVRVLRLIKLVRLLRASRVLNRWKASMAISYATERVVSALIQVVIFAHWEACLMMLVATFQDPVKSYLGCMEYCIDGQVLTGEQVNASGPIRMRQQSVLVDATAPGFFCKGSDELYLASLVWSIVSAPVAARYRISPASLYLLHMCMSNMDMCMHMCNMHMSTCST
jgi:hypothetical protein